MTRKFIALYPQCVLWAWIASAAAIALHAQSGAVIPQGGAGHVDKASCVILKRMGPADQVTSHLYSFGIRGKQFQYVEGKLPEGLPFHGRLTDHDVRNLQGRGAEVIILEPHYTSEDLKQARDQCKGMTGTTPNQATDSPTEPEWPNVRTGTASQAPAHVQPAAATANEKERGTPVTVESTPSGADIQIDGAFVGNTPSTVDVAPGPHEITLGKKGFAPWTRKVNITGGSIHLLAELDKEK